MQNFLGIIVVIIIFIGFMFICNMIKEIVINYLNDKDE